MTQEDNDLMMDCEKLLQNCKELEMEMKAIKEGVDFLINEYKTNKRYFRAEPGKVTIEDIIKTCFESGWASKDDFDYNKRI